MPVTVGVNSLSVVHASSMGTAIAFPDTCTTPAAPSPVPIPYPNNGMSSNTVSGTTQVTCDGNPVCVKDSSWMPSTGDEAGSIGGVASGTIKNKIEFTLYSFDVKFEGKEVVRALDMTLHNNKNTPPSAVLQGPIIVVV